MIKQFVAIIAVVALISACGNTPGERAVSGAGIGAGAGALGGAIVGGSVAGGALVGGLAGAAVGGLTNSNQVYLGQPIWK